MCNPPQLRSLENLELRPLSKLAVESISCATFLIAFLNELEGLEKGNEVDEKQNFLRERDTTLKVIYAWLRWIIIPIRSEIHRRSHVLASTKKQSPLCLRVVDIRLRTKRVDPFHDRLDKLDEKISEINRKITPRKSGGDLEMVQNKMPVASPWEALVSCVLGAKAHYNEGRLIYEHSSR